MTDNALPILFSFRRCPYAIRARMALIYSGVQFERREVNLRHKPSELLSASPKGTVPVLVLPQGAVIDESLEIMLWALSQHDPSSWYPNDQAQRALIDTLIDANDNDFKPLLDRYKYADRFPEKPATQYRAECERFIVRLDHLLQQHRYLISDELSLADIALLPFVRQFAKVDEHWFANTSSQYCYRWLEDLLSSALFVECMRQ